jgi:hypothetical protein
MPRRELVSAERRISTQSEFRSFGKGRSVPFETPSCALVVFLLVLGTVNGLCGPHVPHVQSSVVTHRTAPKPRSGNYYSWFDAGLVLVVAKNTADLTQSLSIPD